MICKRCESHRVIFISGKTSDLCFVDVPHLGIEGDGYVPDFIGKWGDYIELHLCLDCGQVQEEVCISDEVLKKQVKGM